MKAMTVREMLKRKARNHANSNSLTEMLVLVPKMMITTMMKIYL